MTTVYQGGNFWSRMKLLNVRIGFQYELPPPTHRTEARYLLIIELGSQGQSSQ